MSREVVRCDSDKPLIRLEFKGETKRFTPEEILTAMLTNMQETADVFTWKEAKNAVIAFSARFNDPGARRQRTRAGTSCGPSTYRWLLHLRTGLTRVRGAIGTSRSSNQLRESDVSLLAIDESVFDVKATYSGTHLGGEDMNADGDVPRQEVQT